MKRTYTIILLLAISALSELGWLAREEIYFRFALIPAHLHGLRLVTLVSCIFLHATWWHLVGNLIFLGAFAAAVEKYLGGRRMLLLFFAAGVVASLVHVIAHPQSTFPATGASGAIAGLVTYYALRFPQARLTRWGLVAALLLQLLAIWLRQRGLLFPSAWAHLGGAATGIVFSYLGKFRTFR